MSNTTKTHEQTSIELKKMMNDAQEFIFEGDKLLERYSLARARKIRKILDGIARDKVTLRKTMIEEEK